MKVLVIEDNADIMSILEYLLKEEGFEVVACRDGTAMDDLQNIKPDLIVLDELLPAAKGSDLCKKLKADDASKHIPVVIISALAGVQKIAADCNADGYVEKPFNIETFTSVIKSLVR